MRGFTVSSLLSPWTKDPAKIVYSCPVVITVPAVISIPEIFTFEDIPIPEPFRRGGDWLWTRKSTEDQSCLL
jgi:hypothetical protein